MDKKPFDYDDWTPLGLGNFGAYDDLYDDDPSSMKIDPKIGITGESGLHTYLNHFQRALDAALEEIEIQVSEHPEWGIDGIAKNALGMAKHGYLVVEKAISQLKKDYPEMADREILDEIKKNIKHTLVYREAQLVPIPQKKKMKSYTCVKTINLQRGFGIAKEVVIPRNDPLPERGELVEIDGKIWEVYTCESSVYLTDPPRRDEKVYILVKEPKNVGA